MIRILIVEDEQAISRLIQISLRNVGYACDCAFDGKAAVQYLESTSYDLILLDIMLPEIDGFELMEYIRPYKIPVIFLTAKNSVNDRVKGLHLGGDDYIIKPFEIVELIARVEAVLRRYHKNDAILRVEDVEINTESYSVTKGGVPVDLTLKEFELLVLLSRYPNRVFTSRQIFDNLWDSYGIDEDVRTVMVHISNLRKKSSQIRKSPDTSIQ